MPISRRPRCTFRSVEKLVSGTRYPPPKSVFREISLLLSLLASFRDISLVESNENDLANLMHFGYWSLWRRLSVKEGVVFVSSVAPFVGPLDPSMYLVHVLGLKCFDFLVLRHLDSALIEDCKSYFFRFADLQSGFVPLFTVGNDCTRNNNASFAATESNVPRECVERDDGSGTTGDAV